MESQEAYSTESGPAASEPPAPLARSGGGGAALGIYRYPETDTPKNSQLPGKIQRKTDVKKYTDEEREEWKRARERENAERAGIARRWIAEEFTKNGRQPAICQCGRAIKGEGGRIALTEDATIYHDHIQCRSWACPICGHKRAWARALELQDALLAANRRAYKQLFITFTIPHTAKQRTKTVLRHLAGAYHRFRNDKGVKQLLARQGFVGQVKALDFTLTDNGTHAHYHTVYIFDSSDELGELAQEVQRVMLDAWDRAVHRETGRHINRRHGFDVEQIELPRGADEQAEALALYAAKVISIYSSSADKDKGSITPFDLLRQDATEAERQRFLDWYSGQRGVRRLVFSRGLKGRLDIEPHEFERPAQVTIANISAEATDYLRNEAHRQLFADLVTSGQASDAMRWLAERSGGTVLKSLRLVQMLDRGSPPCDCVREELKRQELMQELALLE